MELLTENKGGNRIILGEAEQKGSFMAANILLNDVNTQQQTQ